jgi:hypothetical protein
MPAGVTRFVTSYIWPAVIHFVSLEVRSFLLPFRGGSPNEQGLQLEQLHFGRVFRCALCTNHSLRGRQVSLAALASQASTRWRTNGATEYGSFRWACVAVTELSLLQRPCDGVNMEHHSPVLAPHGPAPAMAWRLAVRSALINAVASCTVRDADCWRLWQGLPREKWALAYVMGQFNIFNKLKPS